MNLSTAHIEVSGDAREERGLGRRPWWTWVDAFDYSVADANADAHALTPAHANTGAHADANTGAHADANAYANADADADADANADADADADADAFDFDL